MSGRGGRRLRRVVAAAVAGSALVLASVAAATTSRRLSLEALVESSDVVVEGRVRAVERVATVVDGRLVPRTRTRVEVDRCLVGACPDELVLVSTEGRLFGLRIRHDGEPAFRRGQAVVVFAEPVAGGHRLVGAGQGAFRIGEPVGGAEDTGSLEVRRATEPGVLLGDKAGLDLDGPLSLRALRDGVASVARGGRGTGGRR